jgi:hypothetical protein
MINSKKSIVKVLTVSAVLLIGTSMSSWAKSPLLEENMSIKVGSEDSNYESVPVATSPIIEQQDGIKIKESSNEAPVGKVQLEPDVKPIKVEAKNPFAELGTSKGATQDSMQVLPAIVEAPVSAPLPQQSVLTDTAHYQSQEPSYTPEQIAAIQHYNQSQQELDAKISNMNDFDKNVLQGYIQAATDQEEASQQSSIFTQITDSEDFGQNEEPQDQSTNTSVSNDSVTNTTEREINDLR